MNTDKILVIRFSSFGDIVQSLSCVAKIKQRFTNCKVDFLTKESFRDLLNCDLIDNRILLKKNQSLLELTLLLHKNRYTKIYDAHNSLRSLLLCFLLSLLNFKFFFSKNLIRKPRFLIKRIFLFQLRKNFFKMPFSGQRDLLMPLKKWNIDESLPRGPLIFSSASDDQLVEAYLAKNHISQYIALAPSAAHTLKRWPKENWIQLIKLNPEKRFILLGGPEDTFLNEFLISNNVFNCAGRFSFGQTISAVKHCRLLISNDTGIMHIAEQLEKPCIALMGPAPFGFPSRQSTQVLEVNLSCRPCSKHGQGPCINLEYQKCLKDISVNRVQNELLNLC